LPSGGAVTCTEFAAVPGAMQIPLSGGSRWNSRPSPQETKTTFAATRSSQIWQWRAHQLAAARPLAADALTFAARVDWHEVAELVDRGCSPELALEIVR
jgi:hypothetical protein